MRRSGRPGVALAFVLAWAVPVLLADDSVLEVFELRNRAAASLVDAVAPQVGEDGAVTAHGGSLIVRASRARMAEIRRIIAALDTPARMLKITVERSDDRSAAQTDVGGAVVVSGGGVAAAGTARRASGQEHGRQVQTLQVIEGMPAQIDLGLAVPITTVGVIVGPGGASVVQGADYLPAVSGMSVVPTATSSGSVILELGLEGGRVLADGTLERDVVNTTVTGRVGEWIEVGGAVRELASRGSGLLGLSKELATRDLQMRVRVDPGS